MRKPNRLRLVDCDLPDDVERQLSAFEDEFDDELQKYFEQLAELTLTQLPGIEAALDLGIALREELLQGAPVSSLSSLQALEDNLGLTNPARNDEATSRLDERKMGAIGLAMINGRFFRMLGGDRIDGYRALWFACGGDYDAFIVSAQSIFALQPGGFSFYQSNPVEPNFPLVNKNFNDLLGLTGYGKSVFFHNLFWNGSISTSSSNRIKLNACGFTEDQIVNVFSSQQPNSDVNFPGALNAITTQLRSLASLLFRPASDPMRQPQWQAESILIDLINKLYLDYRLKKSTNSYILDQAYFSQLVLNLRKEDLKELFEFRPEIHDLELPPDFDAINALVSYAVTLQPGTLINTYMASLPEAGLIPKSQVDLECKIFNLGLALWRHFIIQKPEYGPDLDIQLRELQRSRVPMATTTRFCGRFAGLDPEDFARILGSVTNSATSGLPPVGVTSEIFETVMRREGENDIDGLEDPSETGKSSSGVLTKTAVEAVNSSSKAEEENSTTSGSSGGLPTKETLAQLIARKVSWPDNFLNCTADANLARAAGQESVSSVVDVNTGEELARTPIAPDASPEDAAQYAAEFAIKTTGLSDRTKALDAARGAARGAASKAGAKPLEYAAQIAQAAADAAYNKAVEISREKQEPKPFAGSAAERREVLQQEGRPYNSISGNFELGTCNPLVTQKIGQFLEKNRKKLQAWLVRIINVVQELIVYMQDKIDSFITTFQLTLDTVLSKLEKILSIDLNLSGKLGFENSLLKCAWGVDFGFKLDLLGLLLQYLGGLTASIGTPLKLFLGLMQDFLTRIFCVPIRLFEEFLGARSKLLGKVGCTINDFRLPLEIEELLQLIKGTFELRGLVLRTSIGNWIDMTNQLSKQRNEFTSLSQFASLCQSPQLGATMKAMSKLSLSNAPIAVNETPAISDVIEKGLASFS